MRVIYKAVLYRNTKIYYRDDLLKQVSFTEISGFEDLDSEPLRDSDELYLGDYKLDTIRHRLKIVRIHPMESKYFSRNGKWIRWDENTTLDASAICVIKGEYDPNGGFYTISVALSSCGWLYKYFSSEEERDEAEEELYAIIFRLELPEKKFEKIGLPMTISQVS